MNMVFCLYVCLCTMSVPGVQWIPWNWNYRQLLDVTWVLELKPGLSGRTASDINH